MAGSGPGCGGGSRPQGTPHDDSAANPRRAAARDPFGWLPGLVSGDAVSTPHHDRVLHLLKTSLPYRQSGYTVRTANTLKVLQAAGVDVVAMTPLDFPALHRRRPRAGRGDGRRDAAPATGPAACAAVTSDAFLTGVGASRAADRACGAACSVLHVHSAPRLRRGAGRAGAGAQRGAASRVRGARLLRGVWTKDLARAERSRITRRRRDTDTRCMAAADAVVTLSDTMRNVIVARGIAAERVHVIPNGVDVDTFQPRDRNPALAARHGLTDRFVFGYVSNLDHFREGHELLIEAAIRMRAQGIPATALIVGDGHRRAELERLAARLGADDAVVFTGRVPHADVLDYYALLDVFVIPRVDELAARLVTPLKPYEAMAAGRPLLVSDLDALKEVVGDDRGRVFPAGDVPALVDVLSDMHAHPDQLRGWRSARAPGSSPSGSGRTTRAAISGSMSRCSAAPAEVRDRCL